jgi:hypothetical protein
VDQEPLDKDLPVPQVRCIMDVDVVVVVAVLVLPHQSAQRAWPVQVALVPTAT